MLIIRRGKGVVGISRSCLRLWSDDKNPTMAAATAALNPLPDPLGAPLLLRNNSLKRSKGRKLMPSPPPSVGLPNLFVGVEEPSLMDRWLKADVSLEIKGQLPFLAKSLTQSAELDPLLVVECDNVLGAIEEINQQLGFMSRLVLSREDCHLIYAVIQAHHQGVQLPRDCWDPLPTNLLSNRSLTSSADPFDDFVEKVTVEDDNHKWVYDAIDEQIRHLHEPREWQSLHGLIKHHHPSSNRLSVYRYALEHTGASVLILEGMPHNRSDLIAALRQAGAIAICLQPTSTLESSAPYLHPACNHLQIRLKTASHGAHRLRLMRNYRLMRDLLMQLHSDWRQLPYLPVNLATENATLSLIQAEMPCLETDLGLEHAMGIACLVHGAYVAGHDRMQHLRDALQKHWPVITRSLPMPSAVSAKSKLPDPDTLSKHERKFLSQIVTPGKKAF